jgi:mannose-1-phosphate guanylyltransferase
VPRSSRYAVVLAGGSGTRFWPRSRARAPKQLLPIVGERSMLQETLARISPPLPASRVVVVTARGHAAAVRAQLPRAVHGGLLIEPVGRNTAPAIALAALHVARRTPEASMAVFPADHAIGRVAQFRADLRLAFALAERTGALVTLGVRPAHPETGYGYIRWGRPLTGTRGRAAWVEAFVEKPIRRRAQALLATGRALWNAGIFVWRVDVILAALRRLLPDVMTPLESAFEAGGRALAAAYPRLPAVSIDVGVLERASRVAVVRAHFPWSDVGSWASLAALRAGSNGRNALRGRTLPIDSRGCIVDGGDRLVALLGVEDLVVVDTPDALLVCRKERAQDVRLVVEALRRRGLGRYL